MIYIPDGSTSIGNKMKNIILRIRKKIFQISERMNSIKTHSKISSDSTVKSVGGGSIDIGKRCEIHAGVMILTYGGNIEIGDDCSINPYTIIYGHGGLKIGNKVRIAAHCTIIPANHVFSDPDIPIMHQGLTCEGISIEDDVWIGTGVRVLDGVTVAQGTVVAAGAVVTKSFPPYTILAGVPARAIGSRGSANGLS